MLDEQEYAAILHIGLAANAQNPRIEIRARDILDFRIPDNSEDRLENQQFLGKVICFQQ